MTVTPPTTPLTITTFAPVVIIPVMFVTTIVQHGLGLGLNKGEM